jgi:hypothetical protein
MPLNLSYSKAWIHRVKEMEMLKKFVTGVVMRERMGVDGIGHGDDGGKDVNYLGCVFE